MKTLLAPVDFSKASEAVVNEAADMARTLGGRVVLLTVVQPPVVAAEYAGMIDLGELAAVGQKNARRQLGELEQKLKRDSIDVTTVQVTGAPVPQIIEQADLCNADYIVMGSHGHTALYDLLVGSTTHGVLNRAKCPVVIIPAKKDARKAREEKTEAVLA